MNKNISQKLLQRVIDVAEDAYNQGYNKGYNDGFKDSRKDVLDNIREEIKSAINYQEGEDISEYSIDVDEVLQIIDKHKAESEVEDGKNNH